MKAIRWFMLTFMFICVLACAPAAFAQARQNSFSVVLLVGDTQGPMSLDNLPTAPGIRKALADVKDFLPYHSYRVLDTQWLRVGSTRMKGADDQEYEVSIADVNEVYHTPPTPGVLKIAFKLQESGAAANSSEEFGRSVPASEVERRIDRLKAQLSTAQPDDAKKKLEYEIADAGKQLRMLRAKKLLDSQFEMASGETVVVGTSKIGGGDKALVVLLTAVPGGK